METEDVLQQLDLTASATDLYLTLLREGEGTASAIANEAGINRRLAYDKFEALVDKGIVSYVDKENKRVYKPTDPQRLEELIEDRRQELKDLEQQVDEILPQLMRQYNSDESDREVKILEGKGGLKQLFNDELRQEEKIYLIGSPIEAEDLLEHFLPSWSKRRAEKGIEMKGVFEHEMRGQVGERAPVEDRYLPEGKKSNVSVAIYGDTVGITFWIQEPLVIMIKDQDAADSFMSYFELAWEAAEP
ncbi:MAG: helix-turn-helix domain-containing protein [Candidatus Nanohaloarchaea archaeon]|nr:helix-turn-helix domain-containing protein [Candidatus Nanohaloarchaea archaeon]